MIVYISIGNSDDKLTQVQWARFTADVDELVDEEPGVRVHGRWFSSPQSPFQNACWCIEFDEGTDPTPMRRTLRGLAYGYLQDCISWAVASTEFLTPDPA